MDHPVKAQLSGDPHQVIEVEISILVPMPADKYRNVRPTIRVADHPLPGETWIQAYTRIRKIAQFLWLKELSAELSEADQAARDPAAFIENFFKSLA